MEIMYKLSFRESNVSKFLIKIILKFVIHILCSFKFCKKLLAVKSFILIPRE